MADNTTLNAMASGDVYRSKDRTGVKTSIVALDLNPGGSETLMAGTLPVTQSGTWNVATVTTVSTLTSLTQWNGTTIDTNSGSKSAGTLRVVLATDQPQLTNALKVDGSAVTQPVSGTFWQATQPVSLASVPSHAVTNAGTFAVQDAQLVAGATTIAKAEDVASANADVGVPAMAIQKATPTDTAGTDGDYAMLQMSAGRLWVDASGKTLTVGSHDVTNAGTFAVQAAQSGTWNVGTVTTVSTITNVVHVDDNSGSLTVDNAGTFAVQAVCTNAGTFATQETQLIADNAGFTDGTSKVYPVGYIYDEVAGTALSENDVGAARMNVNRATIACIEDGSTRARYATVTASNALKVDGSAVAQPITDNSGSLTVDAPVGTPVFVKLSDGAASLVGRQAATACLPVVFSNEDTNGQSITGQGSQTAINNNIVLASAGSGSTDCQAYQSITLQIIPAAGTVTAGNITFEGSNDNSTFVSIPLYDSASPNNLPITTYALVAATNRMFSGPLLFRYFRARISTGVTGTTTGVQCYSMLRLTPFVPFGATQVAQQTGTNLNVAIASGTVTTVSTVTSVTAIGTSVTPGVSAGHLGKAEDAVAGSADTGVAVWGVRRDAPATNVNAAGDYAEIPVSGGGTLWCSLTPTTGGGWSISRLLSAATTNATNAKSSAGIVGGWYLYNANASVRYFKLYNKASSPTVGTDTPVMTIPIPAGAACNVEFTNGINFATGISYATTTGVADNDTAAVAANEIIINLLYK